MDKKEGSAKQSRWGWLPAFMPGVARLMAEKRAQWGSDWVNRCWERGVVNGEPGWFFAAEGSITVGVPGDAEALVLFHRHRRPGASLLDMRKPEGAG